MAGCNKYIKRLRCCGQRDNRKTKNEIPDKACIIVLFLILQNFNGYDSANDAEEDEEYDEANPALSACRFCGSDSLFRVAKTTGPVRTLPQQPRSYSPSFHVLLYFGSLSLDNIDGLILLLN